MVHLNFSELKGETQERLLKSSKRDVDQKFDDHIRKHAKQHCTDPDVMIEEETLRNLYSFKYAFSI